MNNDPLVSAIVSTYNSEKFFQGKIEDLLNQTILPKLEIIVVNSGSRQNEDAIIQPYLAKYDCIKYIHTEERETIYKAWNRGIKVAKGKYITNANTDDRLRNNAFEILSCELEKHPDVALVFANQYITNIPNQKFDEVKGSKQWIIPEFDYLVQLDRTVVLSQPMWRASIHFSKDIWFNDKLEVAGDQEFNLRIIRIGRIKYLPIVLGTFYVAKDRSNKSLANKKQHEIEKTAITEKYIVEYIDNLTDNELNQLKRKFEPKLGLPIIVLRATNIIRKFISPKKHPFTHEFVYFTMALIYKKMKRYDKTVKVCLKLLKKKKSIRVRNLLQNVQ